MYARQEGYLFPLWGGGGGGEKRLRNHRNEREQPWLDCAVHLEDALLCSQQLKF